MDTIGVEGWKKIWDVLKDFIFEKLLPILSEQYVHTYKKNVFLFENTWILSRERRVNRVIRRSMCKIILKMSVFIIIYVVLYTLLRKNQNFPDVLLLNNLEQEKYKSLYCFAGIISVVAVVLMGVVDIVKMTADIKIAGMIQNIKAGKLNLKVWILRGMEIIYCSLIFLSVWNKTMREIIFSFMENVAPVILVVCIVCDLLCVGAYCIRDMGDKICSVVLMPCQLKDAMKIYLKIDLEENAEEKETEQRTVNLLTEDLIIGYVDNNIYILPKDIEELEKKGVERYTKEEIYCLKIGNDEKKGVVYVKFIDNEWKRWNI